VLNQRYVGLNPDLKTWEFRVQRIHTIQDGAAQWYDAKAAISVYGVVVPPSYGNWKYQVLALADTTDDSSPNYDDSGWPEGPAPFADRHVDMRRSVVRRSCRMVARWLPGSAPEACRPAASPMPASRDYAG
jgi:hypothetical protein